MLPFARGWQITVFLGTFNKKSLTEDNMQHLNLEFEEMMRWWTFDSESHGSKPFNYRMAWYKRVLWYLLTIPTAKMVFCSPGVEATLTKNTNCGVSSTSSSWRRPQKRTCPETTCFDRFQSSFSGIQWTFLTPKIIQGCPLAARTSNLTFTLYSLYYAPWN